MKTHNYILHTEALTTRALHILDHGDTAMAHDFLCHPEGAACPDGCDLGADPGRLEAYEEAAADAWARDHGGN